MTLVETKVVLQDGMTVKGKSLREHFEHFNHEKCIDLLYQLVGKKLKLTAHEILTIHSLVSRNVEEEIAGRYRTGGVQIVGANFNVPNHLKVNELVDELVQFVNDNPLNLDLIVLTTVFHHRFVWIHPFFDGNGRTVRLIMNLLLMRAGFPPAIILKTDRKKYYQALQLANNGDYSMLCLMMIQAIERSLNLYLNAVPQYEADFESISSIVEDPQVPYSQEYDSLLAKQGKINAYKEGRNWVTTKQAVLDYIRRN